MIKDTAVPQWGEKKIQKNKTKTATNHVTLASWLGGGAFGKEGTLGRGSGENDFSEPGCLFVSPLGHTEVD